jgi:hypothetical protein
MKLVIGPDQDYFYFNDLFEFEFIEKVDIVVYMYDLELLILKLLSLVDFPRILI